MRKFILNIVFGLLMTGVSFAGWFDNKDRERLQQTEQQLAQQRKSTGDWQIIAGLFGLGSVVLFTVGTALGSKVRRHEKEN